ncbi:aromatic acid exporter family protein [Streptomyces sp. NRRL S-87]|uniref:FUSC family protein n=1 Tax=Streptomyces sp. NRRL S-87 TaxID=1463920 RepID=UPI0004C264AB|nr:aromatic acid exporter family protein [Streptomyces sp. NRRL S-87]
MSEQPAVLSKLRRARRNPVVVQSVRSTGAAVVSYVVALQLSNEPAPLTAPLTALLVVQVTLYATVTTSVRRVNSVVAGVLIAIGFSALVGLTWWSLGLIILASLLVGHLVRVDEFVPEVAISAMLVLGVTQVGATAWDRVLETVIGAVVGLLFNLLVAPPVWVEPASRAIDDLATRMAALMTGMVEELSGRTTVAEAASRLHEARRLDNDIAGVDAALRQAEDSLRMNPRVREGLMFRLVLRTGLDTLEICAVVLRVSARALTDLAKARTEEEPLFSPPVTRAVQDLFGHMALAVHSFSRLVTAQVSPNAEEQERRLTAELRMARRSRDLLADLLLDQVRGAPAQWQLHGALLADADRVLDELDVDKRSQRLLEELDRHSRLRYERGRRVRAAVRRVRSGRPS